MVQSPILAGGKANKQAAGRPARPEAQKPADDPPALMSPEAREAQLRQFAQGRIVSVELLHGSRVPRPKRGSARSADVEGRYQGPMEERQIKEAIKRAEPGIAQYLKIMELLPHVNVADSRDFQRQFNGFYRVRQRPPEWYKTYFSFMEQRKQSIPTFDETLDHLWNVLGRCEPSFSSKLVATLDPTEPIWDTFVLQHTKTKRPAYGSKNRVSQAKAAYESIRNWYRQFLSSAEGARVVLLFNQAVAEQQQDHRLKESRFCLVANKDVAQGPPEGQELEIGLRSQFHARNNEKASGGASAWHSSNTS